MRSISLKRPGLILLAFLFSPLIYSETLKIGIIDTGFCPVKLTSQNVSIHTVKDATSSVIIDCNKVDNKNHRFHGQWVLETFLHNAPKDLKLEIWPVIIFDAKAVQKINYWIDAFKYLEEKKVDIVLSASGLPITSLPKELKLTHSKFFVASGREGGPIKSDTHLFPHELAPLPELFIIGSFYPPLHQEDYLLDEHLLYQKQIDYYFSQGPNGDQFVGTSRSVAIALARALEICPSDFFKKGKSLRICLEKNKKLIKDSASKKEIPTF